jgi:hypothetical protein
MAAAGVAPGVEEDVAEDAPPLVAGDVLPVVAVRDAERAGTAAAGGAVVEVRGVDVVAETGGPVVGEDPVRVDVAAQVEAVAAEVPRAPLIEVEAEAAQELRRLVVAPLQPFELKRTVEPPILLNPIEPPPPLSEVRVGSSSTWSASGRWKEWTVLVCSRSIDAASPRTELPTQ